MGFTHHVYSILHIFGSIMQDSLEISRIDPKEFPSLFNLLVGISCICQKKDFTHLRKIITFVVFFGSMTLLFDPDGIDCHSFLSVDLVSTRDSDHKHTLDRFSS
ncbi:hypothetical protein KSP39_PZI003449 [Platanthera zijinensis]|uniref:Uncharacterized protein n=1 Tax=Platanthera zijinensis TaxID=2320716 RepID=A0AAP0BVF8_9ASPA